MLRKYLVARSKHVNGLEQISQQWVLLPNPEHDSRKAKPSFAFRLCWCPCQKEKKENKERRTFTPKKREGKSGDWTSVFPSSHFYLRVKQAEQKEREDILSGGRTWKVKEERKYFSRKLWASENGENAHMVKSYENYYETKGGNIPNPSSYMFYLKKSVNVSISNILRIIVLSFILLYLLCKG